MSKTLELMLATDYDKVDIVMPPLICQPKLNGFRAYWDGEVLASRTQHIWSRKKLPHIYDKLEKFSARHPDLYLDGELYCHGMARQEISKRCSGAAIHPGHQEIDFHVFDTIDDELTSEQRQIRVLESGYEPFVPCGRIEHISQVDKFLKLFVECGFEGMMLRVIDAKYQGGRSQNLIKLKPWIYGTGVVQDTTAGEGKYKGMIGALVIRSGNVEFKVSGGLDDIQRSLRGYWPGRTVRYRFRELSNAGKPLEPQLVFSKP